jgi:hypothetical protein
MKNWYKIAQEIETQQIHNLQDRNRVNAKIHHLEKVMDILVYASKLIHQTQRDARHIVRDVMADKRMSSYPQVKNVLVEADIIAMDSPNNFSILCLEGVHEVGKRIDALKAERKRYTNKELGKSHKGLLM